MPSRRALLATPLPPLGLLSLPAAAQEGFPSRAIAVASGYAPGGVTDVTSRAVAERMARELGVPVVIENRVGAATAVANTHVAQARPDGYTLLMGTSTLAINPALQPNLTPREPMRELVPVGMVFRTAFALHVNPSVPARTTEEFIAWCRANPGRVNFGSSGTGAVNHLAQALLVARTGIDVVHVPFRGGAPALLELRAGRIQAMFQALLEALPTMREGSTRGLAISSRGRNALVPDLPPVADAVPGFEAVFWQALFAPAGTPAPVLARLEAALRAATEDATLRSRMAEQGVDIVTGDAASVRDLLARETSMWGELIRSAQISTGVMMMRLFPLGLMLLLGACGSVDTSPGSSGVPDMPFGRTSFQRGYQTTGGAIVLDRELTPNDPRRFDLPPSNNPRAFSAPPPGDPRRLGW